MSVAKEESRIIKECQRGNVDAFGILVERYKERVYSLAYQLIGDHASADDVTQEVFIRAYRGLKNFQGKSSFYTWVYRIAVNCSYRYLRKNVSFLRKTTNEIDPAVYMDDRLKGRFAPRSPYADAELKETMEILSKSIDRLSVKHKTALIMYEFQGLSIQDIAEILRTSQGTIKSRLHHARLKVRNMMTHVLSSGRDQINTKQKQAK